LGKRNFTLLRRLGALLAIALFLAIDADDLEDFIGNLLSLFRVLLKHFLGVAVDLISGGLVVVTSDLVERSATHVGTLFKEVGVLGGAVAVMVDLVDIKLGGSLEKHVLHL